MWLYKLTTLIVCLQIQHVRTTESDLIIITANKQIINTSQSSVLLSDVSMFGSQNAIDGVDDYHVGSCGCCSVTDNPGANSWWQIDLGQQHLVQALQTYGHTPDLFCRFKPLAVFAAIFKNGYVCLNDKKVKLQGAIIYAGNTSLIHKQYTRVKKYTVSTIYTTGTHFTKTLDDAIISQFFLVESSNAVLSICEFKLFGKVCDVGRFGFGCSHVCHCYDNQTCNGVTGECQTPGCYPGWNGTACNQEFTTIQSAGSPFDNIPVMAGVVTGCVVVLLVLIVATAILCKRRSGNPSNNDTQPPSNISQPTHGENNEGTYYSEIESRHMNLQSHDIPMRVQGSCEVTYYNNESVAVYVAINPKNIDPSTYSSLEH